MFQIYINNAVFAQAAKYMIIAKNDIQTKRSQVCSQWTSAPSFQQPILLDSIDHLIIKGCIATTDRKLTVVGSFQIEGAELNKNQEIIYEKERDFEQNIEQKQICIGRCCIRIQKIRLKEEQVPARGRDQVNLDDEFQLKSEESVESENEQKNFRCQLIFLIHCGFDFYLNEGFRVCIKWGSQEKETSTIKNKIAPFWGQYIMLTGKQNKTAEIQVRDAKNNKLEWMKIQPRSVRIMFPYHLNIRFRDQCVSAYPSIFITILRQDVPLFSILDRQMNLGVRHVGPTTSSRHHEYLLIYKREVEEDDQSKLPVFLQLDMKQYISFETINHMIENSQNKDYQWNHWNLLLPIKSEHAVKNKQQISLLKSTFSKPLVCLYFSLQEAKLFFLKKLWNGVQIIERRQNFEYALKQIYYNQKKLILGKTIELSNIQVEGEQNANEAVSDEDKWRILSQNYIIRKKILDKSNKNTQILKEQIRSKGEYLRQLKKVLIEVRKMNTIMIEKQKSAFVPKKTQKIRENYDSYDLMEIIATLFTKFEELDQRKKINDEMRMRMNTLQHFNEDTEELNRNVVQNSQKLFQQQKMMKQMQAMKKALPKQKQIIRRLEKIFEQREVDREMNDLLKKEHHKLNMIKKKKEANLENVYKIIKERGSTQNSLLHAISSAEQQLVSLNMEYVKLINNN